MNAAFEFSRETFVYFGGYPGCAPFIQDEPRWRAYVRRALIDPNIERDILQMTRVDKRADIRISVDNRIELPIEIKLDSNPKLVRDLREQLVGERDYLRQAHAASLSTQQKLLEAQTGGRSWIERLLPWTRDGGYD